MKLKKKLNKKKKPKKENQINNLPNLHQKVEKPSNLLPSPSTKRKLRNDIDYIEYCFII